MVTPITGVTPPEQTTSTSVQVQSAANSAASSQKSSRPQPTSTGVDTVQISSAATSALQELLETRCQTSQEANKRDQQAQRLLAKEEGTEKTNQK